MISFSPKPASFAVFDEDLDVTWRNRFEKATALSVDTEAMGLIHGRDRLCLVQICDASDNVACIRIKLNQSSAPHLQALMENPSIEKIFHFARFDVAALSSGLKIQVVNIFCTKIASRLARTYTPRHGLKEVLGELLNIELDKKSQCSDWGKVDELSEDQLAYAANDVRYLIAAREQLKKMLLRENRFELAQKCFLCIPVFSELDRSHFHQIFEH